MKGSQVLAAPLKKLHFGAGQYFGPASGLGPIVFAHAGEARAILGDVLRLPIRLDTPFLWDLTVATDETQPDARFCLSRPGALPVAVPVWAGRPATVIGMAGPADPGTGLFTLRIEGTDQPGRILFLGLSLMPLASSGSGFPV